MSSLDKIKFSVTFASVCYSGHGHNARGTQVKLLVSHQRTCVCPAPLQFDLNSPRNKFDLLPADSIHAKCG